MHTTAIIEVAFESSDTAHAAAKGLSTELKKRADAEINVIGKKLTIRINADDVVAFRAMINGYLRHLQAIDALKREK